MQGVNVICAEDKVGSHVSLSGRVDTRGKHLPDVPDNIRPLSTYSCDCSSPLPIFPHRYNNLNFKNIGKV